MSIKVKNIILRDETPFELDNEVILKNNYAYYGKTQLTDRSGLQNVRIADGNILHKTGRHKLYVTGNVENGDYLTTCSLYGTAMKIINKDFASARAVSSRKFPNRKVEIIDVVLLWFMDTSWVRIYHI